LEDYQRIDFQELKQYDEVTIIKKLSEYINTLEIYITDLIYKIVTSDTKTVIVVDAIE
jgi:hypothetical protein